MGELGLPRASSTRRSTAARAATTCTARCSPRRWRAAGPAAWRPGSAGTSASRRRRSASSAPRSRSSAGSCPAIKGEKIGALAITEPGAGSDVAGLQDLRAPRRRRVRRERRRRRSSPTACARDFYVTAVKTTQEGGHHGLSFLVLEKGMPGFEVSRKLEKLGWHASDTGELSFSDVRVPDGEPARRGEQGLLPDHGQLPVGADLRWRSARSAGCRPRSSARSSTRRSARRSAARSAASRRSATSSPRWRRRSRPARDLTYHALRLFISGQDALKEVSMAKLFACDAAVEVADEAVQIHGGYGYMREYDVERGAARRAPRPDRRRHRRDHEGDHRQAAGAVGNTLPMWESG